MNWGAETKDSYTTPDGEISLNDTEAVRAEFARQNKLLDELREKIKQKKSEVLDLEAALDIALKQYQDFMDAIV